MYEILRRESIHNKEEMPFEHWFGSISGWLGQGKCSADLRAFEI